MEILIGTYTTKDSKGIYNIEFKDGIINNPSLYLNIKSPKYLAKYNDYIVSIIDFDNGSGLVLIKDGIIIDSIKYEDISSCFVYVKDNKVYTTNYHEGTFSILKIIDNKFNLIKKILIKEKCGAHQVIEYNNTFLIPCLLIDKLVIFDDKYNLINEIDFEKGSGIRHGLVYKDRLYLLSENTSCLYIVDLNNYKIIDEIILLDKKVNGGSAIRIKDDYLYMAIRNENVIVVYSIKDNKVIDIRNIDGDHPRDFIIVDDYLLCANRFTNNVLCYEIKDDYTLSDKYSFINIPEGVCLIVK